MADKKKKGAEPAPPSESPWLSGVPDVKGVVPPGRRLSPANEKRPTKWSASGVHGVRPPGRQKPGEGPAATAAAAWERKRALREKQNQRLFDAAKSGRTAQQKGQELRYDPGRPVGGFVPNPFAQVRDPKDVKGFLEDISELVKKLALDADHALSMAELIRQSHAPFEILVAFAVLSPMVAKDASQRRKHAAALERGARVFYNLSRRLDPAVKPPRGLVPESVDAIFYDLPPTALQLPLAYVADAFARLAELLRGEEEKDRLLLAGVRDLRKKYITGRSFGDRPLEKMFPYEEPDWAPED